MAYTAITTKTTTSTFTVANLDTIRENLLSLAKKQTFRASSNGIKAVDQAISTSSETAILWDQAAGVEWDPDNIHSTGTNPARITPSVAGVYLVVAAVTFERNVDGVRRIRIRKNGSSVYAERQVDAVPERVTGISCACLVDVNGTTDYLDVPVYQTSGATIDILSGDNEQHGSFFAAVWMGVTTDGSALAISKLGWSDGGWANWSVWFNAEVRDSLDKLHRRPMVRVTSASKTVPDSTYTHFNTWDAQAFDTDGMWDPLNVGRITCNTAGTYLVHAGMKWEPNVTGDRIILFYVNGVSTGVASRTAATGNGSERTTQTAEYLWNAADGDYLQVYVYQSSGGNLDTTVVGATFLDAVLVAATDNTSAQRFTGGWPGVPFDADASHDTWHHRAWWDVSTRDIPNLLWYPPVIQLSLAAPMTLPVRELKEVGFDRAPTDTWDRIGSWRDVRSTISAPISGLYRVGAVVNFKEEAFAQTFTADAATDVVTCRDVNVETGDTFTVASTTTLPAGLAAATTYYAIRIGRDELKVATSAANAYAGTAVNITSTGSGTHTLTLSGQYGSRFARITHNGEAAHAETAIHSKGDSAALVCSTIVAARTEDEFGVEVWQSSKRPALITAGGTKTRMWAIWLAPYAYLNGDSDEDLTKQGLAPTWQR